MNEVYGPITAFGLTILISVCTELVKRKAKASDTKAMGWALIISLAWTLPYHILSTLLEWRTIGQDPQALDWAWFIFGGMFYGFFSWMTATGIYTNAKNIWGSRS